MRLPREHQPAFAQWFWSVMEGTDRDEHRVLAGFELRLGDRPELLRVRRRLVRRCTDAEQFAELVDQLGVWPGQAPNHPIGPPTPFYESTESMRWLSSGLRPSL